MFLKVLFLGKIAQVSHKLVSYKTTFLKFIPNLVNFRNRNFIINIRAFSAMLATELFLENPNFHEAFVSRILRRTSS